MTNFLNNHYEKLVLAFAMLVFIPVTAMIFLDSSQNGGFRGGANTSSFTVDTLDGENIISLPRETKLLPNDTIKFFNSDDEHFEEELISKVIFKKKTKISVQLKNGKILRGRLIASSNLVLQKQWDKSRAPIAIDSENGVVNLNMNEIDSIKGFQKLVLAADLSKYEEENYSVSTYQPISRFLSDSNKTEKTRWTSNIAEKNETIYDLFTPPIIYLVDGKLTTSLPETPKEIEKEEEFGLVLTRFEKKVYRLRLVSWIGEVPYFEDLENKISEKINKNVKNRIELKVPYKNNENYKPGLPSLVKTSMEDENKVLMLEYFTVQPHKDPRTGGVKPVGRALIKDFIQGGDSFEINSLMEKVHSGAFVISLKVTLEGVLSEDIVLTSDDIERELSIGDRRYKILEINKDNKTIQIEKRILGKEDVIISTLNL